MLIEGSKKHLAKKAASILHDTTFRLLGKQKNIVLASSGEDGHIGSLFPNHQSLQKIWHDYFLMDDSPKPPPGRMSAGFDLIQQADTGIVLFFGSSKRKALCHFLNSQLSCTECPARIITQLPYYHVLTDQEMNVL